MGGSTAACVRLVRVKQDVGPSGVVTERGVFHFCSSNSVRDQENPH
ncbi:hypothetical protein [Rummeliibacillus sp. SL167]|nr:hypothetical protein [Rummeliibacillus sp. SL167]